MRMSKQVFSTLVGLVVFLAYLSIGMSWANSYYAKSTVELSTISIYKRNEVISPSEGLTLQETVVRQGDTFRVLLDGGWTWIGGIGKNLNQFGRIPPGEHLICEIPILEKNDCQLIVSLYNVGTTAVSYLDCPIASISVIPVKDNKVSVWGNVLLGEATPDEVETYMSAPFSRDYHNNLRFDYNSGIAYTFAMQNIPHSTQEVAAELYVNFGLTFRG